MPIGKQSSVLHFSELNLFYAVRITIVDFRPSDPVSLQSTMVSLAY
jgi:hypothetical protein